MFSTARSAARVRTALWLLVLATSATPFELPGIETLPQETVDLATYLQCALHPVFTLAGRTGQCSLLGRSDNSGAGVTLEPAFLEAASIVVDVSECKAPQQQQWELPWRVPSVTPPTKFEVQLRPKSSDHKVLWQAFCGSRFAFLPSLARVVRFDRPLTVLDAGAHIGIGSILFAMLLRSQGEVMAVEPHSGSASLLERNVEPWGTVVRIFPVALMDTHRVVDAVLTGPKGRFDEFRLTEDASTLREKWKGEELAEESVRLRTPLRLLNMARNMRFDIIKLDISGEEVNLLRVAAVREVFCEAFCLLVNVQNDTALASSAALSHFVSSGCLHNRRFVRLANPSPYQVLCRVDVLQGGPVAPEHLPDPLTSTEALRLSALEGPLAKLPNRQGPWHPAWTNSVAVCAAMRSENVTDVREWLLHYRWLGVEHVYLTENVLEGEQQMDPYLQDFIDTGFLSYSANSQVASLLLVRYNCLKQHRQKHNWMAFLDTDEFLVVRNASVSLPEFLDEFKFFPGLAVHWVTFGPNGLDTRPPAGGVLRHYLSCTGVAHPHVKLVANMYFVANIGQDMHGMLFRGDASPVNEHRYAVHPYWPFCNDTPEPCDDDASRCCRPVNGIGWSSRDRWEASVDRVAVFHFATRSRADYSVKLESAPSSGSGWGYFNYVAKSANVTGGICSAPGLVAQRCCSEAGYVYQPAHHDDVGDGG